MLKEDKGGLAWESTFFSVNILFSMFDTLGPFDEPECIEATKEVKYSDFLNSWIMTCVKEIKRHYNSKKIY